MFLKTNLFMSEWPHVRLLPKNINPVGYQGEKMYFKGYMVADIAYGDRSIKGKVYVTESDLSILGWVHQYYFPIVANRKAPNQIMVVDEVTLEDIIRDAENVFSERMG